MRSVLSLATFAIGVLCFVALLTKVKPASIIAAPSPSERESSDALHQPSK
ncbi:hypothetical protein V1281_004266 [Nitrobacteraceae bacterium AZCC 2161]